MKNEPQKITIEGRHSKVFFKKLKDEKYKDKNVIFVDEKGEVIKYE